MIRRRNVAVWLVASAFGGGCGAWLWLRVLGPLLLPWR
jgi:hypothetical protein